MNLITVHTAFSPAEAQLVNSQLQAAGFHSVVTGELSALSIDGYSMAAGGIRVQVPETEAPDARLLLSADQEGDSKSADPTS